MKSFLHIGIADNFAVAPRRLTDKEVIVLRNTLRARAEAKRFERHVLGALFMALGVLIALQALAN